MGFHYEEEHIIDGSIDNRTKGKTVLKINFASHHSSLVTLQGNPCRDLAGSLWSFKNPHARMDDEPGAPCFFIPSLCEGTVGRIRYSEKREVPVLPVDEHYDRLFDDKQEDPPTKIAPVLELEWFSQKYGQVEIDCQQITLELQEMAWSPTDKEAAEDEKNLRQIQEQYLTREQESMASFYEDMELIEEYVAHDPEPHELEEQCFLIVQDFVINTVDESDQKQELHGDLLKLQEQIAGAFTHHNDDGEFDDRLQTITLLTGVLPFIDRAATSSQVIAETTTALLLGLREGIVDLRDELSQIK